MVQGYRPSSRPVLPCPQLKQVKEIVWLVNQAAAAWSLAVVQGYRPSSRPVLPCPQLKQVKEIVWLVNQAAAAWSLAVVQGYKASCPHNNQQWVKH